MIGVAVRFCVFLIVINVAHSQSLREIHSVNLTVDVLRDHEGKEYPFKTPLFSFEINGKEYLSNQSSPVAIEFQSDDKFTPGFRGTISFTNSSKDTLHLSNIVPFGRSDKNAFITGLGNHRLSRTHLFLPKKGPVNVIVPDNAWELGYSSTTLTENISVFCLARREDGSAKKSTVKRFETILFPGGSVRYFLYADFYHGSWQEGLRLAFQERLLYDIAEFDESLYQRNDLKWIKEAYVMHLMMAWDNSFYDSNNGTSHLTEFIDRGKKLYGGDDVICLWPTWPTLGIDHRNQFDLYRDLPGGLKNLKVLADTLHTKGSHFFLAYNPWDESTRSEGHLQGLAKLIEATNADGVVLDTKGESSKELQEAADKVKSGVVMYSEGMAVPKDMPGIVSGRVHNALYYPPMLNLNKFIRPDFAIFRVAEVYKEPIQREYAVSFFNGYGTEINQFAPGHPPYEAEQYKYLGKTTRILRENSENFTAGRYTPLIDALHDSIWVNRWELENKTLYSIFSLIPQGFDDLLFEVTADESHHFVDLWRHQEVKPKQIQSKWFINAQTDSFNKSDIGTNNEGEVDCIAKLPKLISYQHNGNELIIHSAKCETIKLWKGDPDYEKTPLIFSGGNFTINLHDTFGRFEGKIVVQGFNGKTLADETSVELKPGAPIRTSVVVKTARAKTPPSGMVLIPPGRFQFNVKNGDEFIPYPKQDVGNTFEMPGIFMDKFPVTNKQFKEFLQKSNYKPSDTSNFLKHWLKGDIVKGEENYPVVFISYEDAKAFAAWSGKRLPTEIEWQYAAQTNSLNEWPWKQTKPVTRKAQFVTETLTVTAIDGIDPKMCNLGDGKLYPVGKYPNGRNPYSLFDLVGCVWQLTDDVYESASYRYIIMKGGSFFKPSSSWWYVQGGPRELNYRQYLLRVSQGFERNATVGFRCVKDKE